MTYSSHLSSQMKADTVKLLERECSLFGQFVMMDSSKLLDLWGWSEVETLSS